VIKIASPANLHPGRRSLAEFQNYWGESHGPLFSNTKPLRRYVQHLTLPESYAINRPPASTFDGCSMFWFDDLEQWPDARTPEAVALRDAVLADDRQLFDRLPGWPLHRKRASVIAEEKIIVDGETTPSMVKAIFIASRVPGLNHDDFFQHWYEVHGKLGARVPGLRRYVQNHALREVYSTRNMTHDGWSELWFDDLDALRKAAASPEWGALSEDGKNLFVQPMGVIIARERVQKWEGRPLKDFGAVGLSENEIRDRLKRENYSALAADPRAPGQIRDAAAAGCLGVWTDEHIVTFDSSRIDARPDGAAERLGL
jgi:uncharacterized protein (TIGR02118 family)